jgi:hypothetical protein
MLYVTHLIIPYHTIGLTLCLYTYKHYTYKHLYGSYYMFFIVRTPEMIYHRRIMKREMSDISGNE